MVQSVAAAVVAAAAAIVELDRPYSNPLPLRHKQTHGLGDMITIETAYTAAGLAAAMLMPVGMREYRA